MITKHIPIQLIIGLLLTPLICLCSFNTIAQPILPQRTITITSTQDIHFGTFCKTGSSGGTVIVGYDGSRTCTGDIVPVNIAPISHEAIFAIKLCQGRNVTITFDALTSLTGSNGGTFLLKLGPTEKGGNGASFSTNSDCNFITPLRMGGTLEVPGTAIPGIYSGSFAITFIQQ